MVGCSVIVAKSKEELVEAYNRYVKRIEAKNITTERKEKMISPGRDILALVSEAGEQIMPSMHSPVSEEGDAHKEEAQSTVTVGG